MVCRKRRLAAEAQANKQAALAGKKAKEQGLLQRDDKPTPEELARRRARAGRFGSGAVDNSTVQAPSYAVSPPCLRSCSIKASGSSAIEQSVASAALL